MLKRQTAQAHGSAADGFVKRLPPTGQRIRYRSLGTRFPGAGNSLNTAIAGTQWPRRFERMDEGRGRLPDGVDDQGGAEATMPGTRHKATRF